jgi:hypothetical protein
LELALGRISRGRQGHYCLKEFRRLTFEKMVGRERVDGRDGAAKPR